MARVLVTGGTGFIGGATAMRLSDIGHDVTAVSRLSAATRGRAEELRERGIRVIKCDVLSSKLSSLFRQIKPEVVVHSAALAGIDPSKTALDYHRINTEGTLRVLLASKEVRARHFVYVGSTSVYGKPIYVPMDERHPTNPVSMYGASMLAGEVYANAFRSDRMHVFTPRFSNTYGPGSKKSGWVTSIVDSVKKNKPPVLYSRGRQRRDFLHVNDAAGAIALGIKKRLDLTLNVASGKETSTLELANLVIRLAGSELKPKLLPKKPGEVDRNCIDIRKAAKFGIRPGINLEDGIRELLR